MATLTESLEQVNVGVNAQRIATRWIPKGSHKIEHRLGCCYVENNLVRMVSRNPVFTVLAYRGSAGKPSFYESYHNAEQRDARIARFFADLESSEVMMSQRKAERSKPHTLQVGDIIHHSWGWEQTQCDYYQVLSVTAHTAIIRAICSETVEDSTFSHGMADRRMPVKDAFVSTDEPFRVRVDGSGYICMKHGSATKWDGRANFCSWYA